MNNTTPEHEKLFDEICNKLNELSHRDDISLPQTNKIEKMQTQIKKFHSDLLDTQDEFRNKIKSLENLQVSKSEHNGQLRVLTEQLQAERNINTKLNADLVKSNEIALHLQLEMQGLKSRAQQIQNEERKYNIQLQEKIKNSQKDLELNEALKEELTLELAKTKNQYQIDRDEWQNEKERISANVEELNQRMIDKDTQIMALNNQIEDLQSALNEIEEASHKQNENMKNLMTVAENKIVELKMGYDKKHIESQDYYNHLQQGLTQINLLKQENASLKEYVSKVNQYLQQQQLVQNSQSAAAAHTPGASAKPN
jgi:chromosome segregation ATPase